MIVDKTGTLTEGKPKVTDIIPVDGIDQNELLTLAASLERGAEHPLAGAIIKGAEDRGLKLSNSEDFEAITGKGVTGKIGIKKVSLGNARMMDVLNIDITSLHHRADELRDEGKTTMFIAIDNQFSGLIAVADPIKPSTFEAIKAIHAAGLKIIMATGDNKRTAMAVASKLGIDEIRADVLPEDKKALVDELHSNGNYVTMAGDGVNDAPALAAADVGIAMGTGADVAVESAGFTLVKGNLDGIIRARNLSQGTISNIKQNLFFAFAYNVAGIPIAAGILYPHTGWLLSPMIAAAAMSLSSVSVIANALRLRHVNLYH